MKEAKELFYSQWLSDSLTHPDCTYAPLGGPHLVLSCYHHHPKAFLQCLLENLQILRTSPSGQEIMSSLFPPPPLCVQVPSHPSPPPPAVGRLEVESFLLHKQHLCGWL